MRTSPVCIVLACISLNALANEQKIFKCTDPSGTVVFSPTECGKDAKEIAVDTSRTIGGTNGPDRALQAISDSVADSDCRRAANNLYDFATAAKIDAISNTHWVGSSAAQRQTMRRMDEQEMMALQQSLAASQKLVSDALAECDRRKPRP